MFINGHVILGPQGWLAPLLCEKAMGAYGRISCNQLIGEAYRKKFRNCKQQNDETF